MLATVNLLFEVLATPSEAVQKAVSECLPPLMPAVAGSREDMEALLQKLLTRLTQSDRYADRYPPSTCLLSLST